MLRVIPIVPVERLTFLVLLPKQFHGGFMICLFLGMVSCGIFNMLGESSVGLLRPFIDVTASDVEVVKPLSEVTITSGGE